MKMPEKHDLLSRHSRGKGTRHQQLALAMAYLRGRYTAVRLQNSNRRKIDKRHYRLVYS